MVGTMDILIRGMTIEDYRQIYELWADIKGFGIRSIDDSRGGVERFLKKNPATSVVAVQNGLIIGNILCRHGERTGCFYHVCMAPGYRRHGIGYCMVRTAMKVPQRERVNKTSLIAFRNNEMGNAFWQGIGWTERGDVNSYESVLDEESITRFMH